MRKFLFAISMVAVVALNIASSALAFEGGGRKPSEAPLIAVGQHYTGQLNNHKNDANYAGFMEVAHWRLPPLTTRDVVTVDWHTVPFTRSPGIFPVCLTLPQQVDDFNWGSVFHDVTDNECETGTGVYEVTGSGTARTEITVQETNANSSYLQFFSYANSTEPPYLETYPYDFTVQPILHYLALAAKPVKRVSASGIFRATANLATGLPAPDGLPFNLAVTWPGNSVANYTGTSSGGTVSFQLALPETAYGKNATFEVSHPADGTYQAITASKLQVLVAKPKVVPVQATPCEKAQRRVRVLARQHQRLVRNARRARRAGRARLHRQAMRVGRELRAARAQARRICTA